MEIKVVREILAANDRVAAGIRMRVQEAGVSMVNIMGSPGSGKTLLLERTIEGLGEGVRVGVIEGDIRTSMDAERLSRFDVPVVQINTEPFGGDCHLPATAIERALDGLDLDAIDLLVVENVGNLVCPAEFDIGEARKIVVLSLTEGEDKPLKYPLMFREAHVMVVNKTDLLPHLDVTVGAVEKNARSVHPDIEVFPLSARTGEGMKPWLEWLMGLRGTAADSGVIGDGA